MFEYMSRMDGPSMPYPPSASAATAAQDELLGPPIPPPITHWIWKSVSDRFLCDAAKADEWISTVRRHAKLTPEISSHLQTRIKLLADLSTRRAADAAGEQDAAASWKWIRDECLCFAAQRVALAQRTYLWLLDWRASLEQLKELLAAKPALRAHANFAPLVADLLAAPPAIQGLKLQMADTDRANADVAFQLTTLEERTQAVGMYLGALCCLHTYLAQDATALPAGMPPRTSAQCLGLGATWLCARLADNADAAHQGKLDLWTADELAQQWRIVSNGTETESLAPDASALLRELGLTAIPDADGATLCVASRRDDVRSATRDPEATIAAVFLERHMLRVLEQALNAVFSSKYTRNAQADPSALPTAETPFPVKCEQVYGIKVAQHS